MPALVAVAVSPVGDAGGDGTGAGGGGPPPLPCPLPRAVATGCVCEIVGFAATGCFGFVGAAVALEANTAAAARAMRSRSDTTCRV
jgi:hypothetical protein